jgi:hypothetical protein
MTRNGPQPNPIQSHLCHIRLHRPEPSKAARPHLSLTENRHQH